ncbi:GNAT family N-acetyltransferase [Rhizobiaceae bacterium BDR2-2]|uniref:GNAT family N-acetyltransferase n=1 Tax=Ectorhizobium quercum TaxID=2965071 RepID=A0AAE3SUT1_9HYPH|nr:GNAT family N-acetyltransferase [Ectorhizobium quercum]MCX8997043.1 GNAT family N-acetyltransferase [Ectorhizobium quercum]
MTSPAPSISTGKTVELRRLAASDSITELTDLLHRAYARLAAMGLRYMATHQSETVTLERIDQGECYVAVAEGRLVGTIVFKEAARTAGSPWLDRPEIASLGQFAVDPGLQAQGLGRRLLDFVEGRARQTGAREIALDTAEPATHLVQWYGRCGYRLIEHVRWSHTNYRSVIMSKPLGPAVTP